MWTVHRWERGYGRSPQPNQANSKPKNSSANCGFHFSLTCWQMVNLKTPTAGIWRAIQQPWHNNRHLESTWRVDLAHFECNHCSNLPFQAENPPFFSILSPILFTFLLSFCNGLRFISWTWYSWWEKWREKGWWRKSTEISNWFSSMEVCDKDWGRERRRNHKIYMLPL